MRVPTTRELSLLVMDRFLSSAMATNTTRHRAGEQRPLEGPWGVFGVGKPHRSGMDHI
jgi:hypothetical protein